MKQAIYALVKGKYYRLDTFNDEKLSITSKLNDIEDLGKVFSDTSYPFTIPPSKVNNEVFSHYYDSDIDNAFNANIRVPSIIEIDSFPFKIGELQLEEVKMKDNKPFSYKVTFYSNNNQLKDKFGDETLADLPLSMYNVDNSEENFLKLIGGDTTILDNDVIIPLINYSNRDWNYGGSNSYDISSYLGPVKYEETRPALRVEKIIKAIESKYSVTFESDFFKSAKFRNLYLWLNNDSAKSQIVSNIINIYQPMGGINNGDISIVNGNVRFGIYEKFRPSYPYHSTNRIKHRLIYQVTPDDLTVKYDMRMVDVDTGDILREKLNVSGYQAIEKEWLSTHTTSSLLINVYKTIKLEVVPTKRMGITVVMRADKKNPYIGTTYVDVVSPVNYSIAQSFVSTKDNIPKMKVIDFLTGIMKMFKMIIRPLASSKFLIDPLNYYYNSGNILDLTEHIDHKDINISRPELYSNISFKFEKTENVTGKKYRELYNPITEIGYGDLLAEFNTSDKKTYDIKIPFENMLFENLYVQVSDENTGITIGQSISLDDNQVDIKINKTKALLFYNNGINNHSDFPIKVKYGIEDDDVDVYQTYNIGNTNSKFIQQVTDSINFGVEIDPFHTTEITTNLYSNYWASWISTIYDYKQRKFSYEGILPPRFVEELSLNDRIIIGSVRYKIEEYTVDVSSGKTKLSLFRDIFTWSPVPTDISLLESYVTSYSQALIDIPLTFSANVTNIVINDIGYGDDWVILDTSTKYQLTFKVDENNSTPSYGREVEVDITYIHPSLGSLTQTITIIQEGID